VGPASHLEVVVQWAAPRIDATAPSLPETKRSFWNQAILVLILTTQSADASTPC